MLSIKTGLQYTEECKKSIETKEIHFSKNVTNKHIIKALKQGYSFDYKFWNDNCDLLNIEIGEIYELNFPIKIGLDNLSEKKFKSRDYNIFITDISNTKKKD